MAPRFPRGVSMLALQSRRLALRQTSLENWNLVKLGESVSFSRLALNLCGAFRSDECAYFFFAQRRFAPAIILARASGVIAFLAFFAPADAAGFAGALEPFLLAAQRAFIIAASLARPSSVSPPFFFAAAAGLAGDDAAFGEAGAVPLILAQRARVDAAIFARASGDRVRRPPFFDGFGLCTLETAAGEPPKRDASSACRISIFSAISTARFSCPMDGVLVGIGLTISRRRPISSTVI